MKYEKFVLEFEKYESLDIIAANPDPVDPTEGTSDPQKGADPYQNDKW